MNMPCKKKLTFLNWYTVFALKFSKVQFSSWQCSCDAALQAMLQDYWHKHLQGGSRAQQLRPVSCHHNSCNTTLATVTLTTTPISPQQLQPPWFYHDSCYHNICTTMIATTIMRKYEQAGKWELKSTISGTKHPQMNALPTRMSRDMGALTRVIIVASVCLSFCLFCIIKWHCCLHTKIFFLDFFLRCLFVCSKNKSNIVLKIIIHAEYNFDCGQR